MENAIFNLSALQKISFVLILTTISACGKPNAPAIVEPELGEYADRFEKDVGFSAANIDIIFDNLTDNIVGLCTTGLGRKPEIKVDKGFWERSSDTAREELMYHELGHCALGLNHDKTVMSDGCPQSVMFPYVFSSCYKRQKDHYVSDLKQKSR